MAPPETVVLSSAAEITAALTDHTLIPPPAPASGATMALRAEMARFSAPSTHGPRRAAVESAITSIDLVAAKGCASAFTTAWLDRARGTTAPLQLISAIGRPVTVATMATSFGAPASELDAITSDVDAIAAVIGRGEAPSARSDAAVERLSTTFAAHPLGRVAVLSALYQSADATAALAAVRLLDRCTGVPTALPIARTKRIASATTDIAGRAIAADTPVDLEIGAAGMWFGAGPHACPGQALAETIAAAIVDTIITSGAAVDVQSIALDADRRPVEVWLLPAPST